MNEEIRLCAICDHSDWLHNELPCDHEFKPKGANPVQRNTSRLGASVAAIAAVITLAGPATAAPTPAARVVRG